VLQCPFLGKSENAHFIIFINTRGHVLSANIRCYYQFVTHILTRPKKDGTHRVTLSLKSFNDYIDNFNFKMDNLSTAINLTNK
jgi:hypothetical protein